MNSQRIHYARQIQSLLLCRPKNDGDGDEGMEGDDHEEEFYYTELEVGVTSPPPTLSHRDMARPPHEGAFNSFIFNSFLISFLFFFFFFLK